MSDCTLSNESFAGKVAGDAYLDAEFRCKTCGRLAGQHPAPLGKNHRLISFVFFGSFLFLIVVLSFHTFV